MARSRSQGRAAVAAQFACAAGFVAVTAWLGWGSSLGEPVSWENVAEAALYFAFWGGPAVLAGAVLPRLAPRLPLPVIATTALLAEASGRASGTMHAVDWLVQLAVTQTLVVAAAALAVRSGKAAERPPPARRDATRPAFVALAVAVAVPWALEALWSGRHEPRSWSCFQAMPAGQLAELARWREGLAPAVAVAVVALLACALALSRLRTGSGRVGTPTFVAAGAVGAWAAAAVVSEPVLEWLSGLGLLLVLGAPITAPALLGAFAWALRRPRGVRLAAWASVAVWLSLAVTLGSVGGGIVEKGDEPVLCLD